MSIKFRLSIIIAIAFLLLLGCRVIKIAYPNNEVVSEENDSTMSYVYKTKTELQEMSSYAVVIEYSFENSEDFSAEALSVISECSVDVREQKSYCSSFYDYFKDGASVDVFNFEQVSQGGQIWVNKNESEWIKIKQLRVDDIGFIGGFVDPVLVLDKAVQARFDGEYEYPDNTVQEISFWVDSQEYMKLLFGGSVGKEILRNGNVIGSSCLMWREKENDVIQEYSCMLDIELDGIDYRIWLNYVFSNFNEPVTIPEIQS